MKIAFFNSSKIWGGGEKWHLEVSTAMYENGFETIVFTKEKSKLHFRLSLTDQKIYPTSISNLSFLNPFKIISLKKIFQKEEIDCIILNLSSDLKVAGIAARLAGVKKIIYRRGSAIPIRNSFLNRYLFSNVITDIIANSNETKRTILENNHKLFPANKIKVIYNGLDIEKYHKAEVIKTFPREDKESIIGNLGRLVSQKGQFYLVKLARILKERNISARILIGGEGPLKKHIEALARKAHVSDMIQFVGFVDDVKGFISSIDIFVHTSLWEGFGYIIAEAMYFEKPVIAFNVSSNPELIEHEKNGFLFNLGNIDSIANKIALLQKNKDIVEKVGKAGQECVVRNFTLKKTVDELRSFLQ
jgi:glycosyltransferase involved in cell wall biosynthesis